MCPRCGAVVPFTGAFDFVLCPKCKAVIHGAQAERAPAALVAVAPAPYSVPLAAQIKFGAPATLPEEIHFVRRVARGATTAGAAICAYFLLNNLLALFLGAPTAVAYARSTPEPFVGLFVAFPYRFDFLEFGGPAAAAWHFLLVGVIGISAATLVGTYGRDAWAKFHAAVIGQGAPTLSEPNGLFVLARLYAVTAFLSLIVVIIAEAMGEHPNRPGVGGGNLGAALLLYAHASVWEEIVTRVLLLGVPLLLIHLATRADSERPWWKYLVGGGLPVEAPAFAFLVFQAGVFGVAHVPSYDLWKLPGAFVAGLALGYLFLRYGLAAAIVLHFLFDYLSVSAFLGGTTEYFQLLDLASYVIVIVGAVQAVRYVFVLREIAAEGRLPDYIAGTKRPRPTPDPSNDAGVRMGERALPPGGRG